MDKFDKAILTSLLDNGRMSYARIAERAALSASACLRRVKSLEGRGIIEHFTVALSTRAMGQKIRAFITIKVDRHEMDAVQKFLDRIVTCPEVIACHQLTGQIDFIVEVCTHDIDSYAAFLDKKILSIPSVLDASSSIVLKEVKRHRVGVPEE